MPRNGIPTLAVVGPSRSGKDEMGLWLRDHTELRFGGGCSWTVRHYIAGELGLTVEEAWWTRHERRMEWYDLCCEYRRDDPARIIRECLEHSDVVVGVRDRNEMWQAIDEGLIDLVVWVERDVPRDPTLTFGPDVADVIIQNKRSLADFHNKLCHLAKAMKILKLGVPTPTPPG